ncbi:MULTISPECIES: hypothetical protein [Arsenicicoccus]|uniref:hypothetical protein n=1 Tax=Arsenicicoccus TaxID=267408 RepID=UPI00257E2742|nr:MULTISPECIES: hypothetical protein [Arsenicicoccus]
MNSNAIATTPIHDAIKTTACPTWCTVTADEHIAELRDYDGTLVHRARFDQSSEDYEVEAACSTTLTGDAIDDNPSLYTVPPTPSAGPAVFTAYALDVAAAAEALREFTASHAPATGDAA